MSEQKSERADRDGAGSMPGIRARGPVASQSGRSRVHEFHPQSKVRGKGQPPWIAMTNKPQLRRDWLSIDLWLVRRRLPKSRKE